MRRLFDRYRQFEALPPDEVSRELRERRDEERAREVVFVPELDLARTAWHEPPHPEAVNAATFALRRRMNAYPDPAATEVRELRGRAPRPAARPGRGRPRRRRAAAGRLRAAARRRRAARRVAGLAPAARPRRSAPAAGPVAGGRALDALGRARVGADTRAVALSSPNDPTGAPVARADVRALCERVGERVWVLLDEAFADFLEPGEDAAALVAELPNLLVVPHVRQGARDGGLPHRLRARADRRAGRAADALVLASTRPRRRPRRGRSSSATRCSPAAAPPRRASASGSPRALRGTSFSFPPDRRPVRVAELGRRARRRGDRRRTSRVRRIVVAPGERWGDERHVRITLRDAAATDRLIAALRELG